MMMIIIILTCAGGHRLEAELSLAPPQELLGAGCTIL